MDQHIVHQTHGRTCSSQVSFDVIDGRVRHIQFLGGCPGNTRAVAILAEGMTPEEIKLKLSGVPCHGSSSCPNELALAMDEIKR